MFNWLVVCRYMLVAYGESFLQIIQSTNYEIRTKKEVKSHNSKLIFLCQKK